MVPETDLNKLVEQKALGQNRQNRMSSELIVEFWRVVKDYLDKKEKQVVADHVITALVELGIDDNDLIDLAQVDHYMRNAVAEHIEIDSTDEPEDE